MDMRKELVKNIRNADQTIEMFGDLTRLVIRDGLKSPKTAMSYIEAFNQTLRMMELREILAQYGRTVYGIDIK